MNRTFSVPGGVRALGLVAAFATASLATRAAVAAPTAADQRAQAAFDEGDAFMKAQRYREACDKYRESETLAPSGGAVIKLGECNDKLGNAVEAFNDFEDGADLAHAAGKPDIETYARDRANSERPKVAVMTIDAALSPGEEVSVDDAPCDLAVWAKGRAVTPGDHKLSARAAGHAPFQLAIHPAAGETRALHVPALAPGNDPGPGAPASSNGTGQRVAGIAIGAVGLGGLIAGGVFGGVALSTNSSALSHCRTPTLCTQQGLDLTNRAETLAHASTALLVIGGALTGVGVIVAVTAPRSPKERSASIEIEPALGFEGGGVRIRGAF